MMLDLPHNLTGTLDRGDYEAPAGFSVVSDNTGIPGILAGILIPHIVCTIFVVLRVFSRLKCLRKWYIDDTLIVVAWAWSTAVSVVYTMAVQVPRFRDADITPSSPITPYLTRTYLGLIFYQLSLCFTKLSIGTFYLRMFNSKPAMRTVSWLTIALTVIFSIPLTFMSIFQCYPDKGQVLGRELACISFTELLVFSSCVHTATDAWIIIMIVPTISRLELPSRQKAAVSVILSLGIFVIAASMIRLQLSLHKEFKPTMGVLGSNTMAFFVVTVLECDIAIVCASAPMVRPILKQMKPSFVLYQPPPRTSPRMRRVGSSFNLTTVVSYHGYPWTGQNTPMERSRAGSLANMRVGIPKTPAPALTLSQAHRTPSSLSLKSMLPGNRRRGLTMGPDTQPMLSKSDEELVRQRTRRNSSIGFEGYEDQYLGYGERRAKKFKGAPIDTTAAACASVGGSGRFSSSQESFMSPRDPASPRTLSPRSGLSGDTVRGSCADLETRLEKSVEMERCESGRS